MRTPTLLLGLLLLAGCDEGAGVGIKTGQRAPEFVGRDSEGKTVRLADLKGKVVVLDFWATWCGPCVGSIPHEKEMVQKFSGKPFVLLGISQDHSPEALQRFLAVQPLPWANIYDDNQAISDTWELTAIPTFVVLDEKGVVRGRFEGARLGPVEKKVEELLAKLAPQ